MFVIKTFCLTLLAIILLSLAASVAQALAQRDARPQEGWWSARRDSAGIAPDPRQNRRQAVVQVYAAPTWGWKGVVAVHPWIIFKRAGETEYHRYEVISWGRATKFAIIVMPLMATGTARSPACWPIFAGPTLRR